MPQPAACLAVVALLGAAVCALYLPLRHAEFLDYDDPRHVTENAFTRAGFSWAGIVWAFSSAEPNWNPLTWLSHMLDAQLFGLSPGAHHMSSVLLHAVNCGLLFYALVRLSRDLWASAFVAALLALHPLHVETVAWVSARPHLLSAGLCFAGLLSYALYVERRTPCRYAMVGACMMLDLFNRGLTVTLPFLLLLLDCWPLGRWPTGSGSERREEGGGRTAEPWALIREKMPLFALSLAGMMVQVLSRRRSGALLSLESVPFSVRLADAVVGYATYARRLLWPSDLALPYPLQPGFPPMSALAASLAFLIAASAVAAIAGRRRGQLLVGWLWYFVALLPLIGLVEIGQAVADRYAYVPLVGLGIAVAWSVAGAVRTDARLRVAAAAGAAAALALCAGASRSQIGYWHDGVRLFERAIAVTGPNSIAENNLGTALERVGRRDEARAHYERAVRANPLNPEARNNFGVALARERRFDLAEEQLRESLRIRPAYLSATMNLGRVLLQRGDAAASHEQFRRAVEIDPGSAAAHFGLARALETQGRVAEAVAEYRATLQLDPHHAPAQTQLGRLGAAG